MDDIIKIAKSVKSSGPLVDNATETAKIETKKEGGFLGGMVLPMGASLIAPMASSLLQYLVLINKYNN